MEKKFLEKSKVLKINEVIELTSLPRSTIYFLIKKRKFPKPIRLSDRRVGWLYKDILEWIHKKKVENEKYEKRSVK